MELNDIAVKLVRDSWYEVQESIKLIRVPGFDNKFGITNSDYIELGTLSVCVMRPGTHFVVNTTKAMSRWQLVDASNNLHQELFYFNNPNMLTELKNFLLKNIDYYKRK